MFFGNYVSDAFRELFLAAVENRKRIGVAGQRRQRYNRCSVSFSVSVTIFVAGSVLLGKKPLTVTTGKKTTSTMTTTTTTTTLSFTLLPLLLFDFETEVGVVKYRGAAFYFLQDLT